MSSLRYFSWQVALMAFGAVLWVTPASAVLGGDVVSVQSDAVRMKGSIQTTSTTAYTQHTIKAVTGTSVREYVSPAGKVFAVGWQGPHTPNLKQLLGPYFPQFQQAVAEAHRSHVGRHPISVQVGGISVQLGGHMRALAGQVTVPDLVPQGVHVNQLH